MSALSIARRSISSMSRFAVRERTSDNQMVMFTIVAVTTLAVMLLLPSPRAAFGAVERGSVVDEIRTTGKAGRLPVQSDTDRACHGNVWGAESLDCILAIAADSGVSRTVRLADAELRH